MKPPNAALVLLALLQIGPVIAADHPVPSAKRIRACIEEFDTSGRYAFQWKLLEVGQPRHPQNHFEALAPARRIWT